MTASADRLTGVSRTLACRVDALSFSPPVVSVYNPLLYARDAHEAFIRRWAADTVSAVLVGMNPGPFGMAQTGVPFGDVSCVRDFLRIEYPVNKPPKEHPRRPVTGFACTRREVSGTRVWNWVAARYLTPEAFFRHYWIANYCPLVFMTESGANLTPDKLNRDEQQTLFAACDEALAETCRVLSATHVVGIGAFAAARCAVTAERLGIQSGQILHPSPASPAANRGWAKQAEQGLKALNIFY